MKLTELLKGIPAEINRNIESLDINGIQYDSRKIQPGNLFITWHGEKTDGHQYIPSAIENGAVAVLMEKFTQDDICQIKVHEPRQDMALISARFYQTDTSGLLLTAVTGTNGKTTTTFLFKAIGEKLGQKTGIIGTLGVQGISESNQSALTTPESRDIHHFIHTFASNGFSAVIMEASSIALVQSRLNGLTFQSTGFSNLTQDHLDFHTDMNDYYLAKKILFSMRAPRGAALINIDDRAGKELLNSIHSPKFSYSLHNTHADYFYETLICSPTGMSGLIHTPRKTMAVAVSLPGKFNAYNLILAISMWDQLTHLPDSLDLSDMQPVPGRMEAIQTKSHGTAIIDFAHTPDAIHNILNALNEIKNTGRLIVITGAGGNRDRSKRPVMAAAALESADLLILSTDNPRDEKPAQIIQDMLKGIPADSSKTRIIEDRVQAIHTALAHSDKQDIIAILGKGAEPYMEIAGTKYPYSDQQTVLDWINQYED